MYITVKEAANQLGVHPQTIYNWVRKGILPKYQLSPRHRVLILTDDLSSHTIPTQATPDQHSPAQPSPHQSIPNQYQT